MNHLIYIALLLDRSGSMRTILNSTVEGVNKFLKEHRTAPGKALVTISQFDHEYEQISSGPVDRVDDLSYKTFIPRGGTALYDGIGRLIGEVEEDIASMPDDQKPTSVIFAIVTDGGENCSKEFSSEQVKSLIQQKAETGWEFTYLGANQDAILTASNIGIKGSRSLTYGTSGQSVKNAWASLSNTTNAYRTVLEKEVRTSGNLEIATANAACAMSFDEDDRASAS